MIATSELNEIADYISQHGVSEQVICDLRKRYADRHFTYCMEDDIGAGHAVLSRDKFAIYLVNSANHCSVLTADMDNASGYVIAEIIDDG